MQLSSVRETSVNKLPGMVELARKQDFTILMRRMQALFPAGKTISSTVFCSVDRFFYVPIVKKNVVSVYPEFYQNFQESKIAYYWW